MTTPTSLTMPQKLQALHHRYYNRSVWVPQAGDYYTTCRNDLELYRVAKIENGKIYTEYCTQPGALSEWDEATFTTEGFGQFRVHVPEYVFTHY